MFNSNLLLGKDFAQKYIPHLHFTGPVDNNGFSLSVVGRALLHNRVTEEVPLTIEVRDLITPDEHVEPQDNTLLIYRTNDFREDAAIIRILDQWNAKLCPAYEVNQQMDVFLTKLRSDSTVPVFRYYVDTEHHKAIAVLLSSEYNIAWIVQSTLHQLLPWLFVDDRSDEEKNFVKSIWRTGGSEEDTAYIKKIEALYDMEQAWLLETMRVWTHDMATRRYSAIRSNIENLESNLRNTQTTYARLYKELLQEKERENEARRTAVSQTESGNELVEMFATTKSLELDHIEGKQMVFRVYTNLSSWDEEAYRNNVATDDSYIWLDDDGDYRCDDDARNEWRQLFDDIFINDRFRLQVQAEFTLDMDDCDVNGRGCSGSSARDGYINNPHIGGYGCMGQNVSLVTEALAKGNMVYAIDQCIHSAGNFNFDDSTVGNSMFHKLFSYRDKCIYDTVTGEIITIREALRRANA